MPRRRRSVFASRPSYGRSAMWLEPGSMRRRRGPRRFLAPFMAVLALGAAIAAVVYVVLGTRDNDPRPAAAQKFAAAWAKGDRVAMRNLLDDDTKKAYSQKRFNATYRAAERAATVTAVRTGKVQKTRGGRFVVPVAVRTRVFGTLRGVVVLPMVQTGGEGRVRWRPFLRLPGLRPGESVHAPRCSRAPRRAAILAADGRPARTASGHGRRSSARRPAATAPAAGSSARYDERLGGRPGAELRFGHRADPPREGRAAGSSVHATICPGLQRAAASRRSATGSAASRSCARATASVLALAGPRGLGARSRPGSTFKIITLSAALPERHRQAVEHLSGPHRGDAVGRPAAQREQRVLRRVARATRSPISCNSVFAPLGAKLGAQAARRPPPSASASTRRRASRRQGRAGSRRPPRCKDASPSARRRSARTATSPRRCRWRASARRSPRRACARSPRIVAQRPGDPPPRGPARRSPRQVRDDDARRRQRRHRHGRARSPASRSRARPARPSCARPPAAPPDPKNTDAWFVAFAPGQAPRSPSRVMLVGAGRGRRGRGADRAPGAAGGVVALTPAATAFAGQPALLRICVAAPRTGRIDR